MSALTQLIPIWNKLCHDSRIDEQEASRFKEFCCWEAVERIVGIWVRWDQRFWNLKLYFKFLCRKKELKLSFPDFCSHRSQGMPSHPVNLNRVVVVKIPKPSTFADGDRARGESFIRWKTPKPIPSFCTHLVRTYVVTVELTSRKLLGSNKFVVGKLLGE